MSKRLDFYIETRKDLIDAINTFGFLPLFSNSIPGFSAEEHTAPQVLWGAEDGLWEWKGPAIQESGCAYGKFLMGKATFISREWFPDFANVRRDGYDFDARYDEGLAPHREKVLFDLIDGHAPIISLQLKELGGYGKSAVKGFDTTISRLQSQCYVLISNFTYRIGKRGQRKGWGLAEYNTPERWLREAFSEHVYERDPAESKALVLDHLHELLPNTRTDALEKLLNH